MQPKLREAMSLDLHSRLTSLGLLKFQESKNKLYLKRPKEDQIIKFRGNFKRDKEVVRDRDLTNILGRPII